MKRPQVLLVLITLVSLSANAGIFGAPDPLKICESDAELPKTATRAKIDCQGSDDQEACDVRKFILASNYTLENCDRIMKFYCETVLPVANSDDDCAEYDKARGR